MTSDVLRRVRGSRTLVGRKQGRKEGQSFCVVYRVLSLLCIQSTQTDVCLWTFGWEPTREPSSSPLAEDEEREVRLSLSIMPSHDNDQSDGRSFKPAQLGIIYRLGPLHIPAHSIQQQPSECEKSISQILYKYIRWIVVQKGVVSSRQRHATNNGSWPPKRVKHPSCFRGPLSHGLSPVYHVVRHLSHSTTPKISLDYATHTS